MATFLLKSLINRQKINFDIATETHIHPKKDIYFSIKKLDYFMKNKPPCSTFCKPGYDETDEPQA